MIVPVNWLKKYTSIDMPIDQLTELIGARLVEIESVSDLNKKYQDVITAYVVEADNLEGSDHLRLTKIDDGGVRANVERDERGLIQVVCGAANVMAGQVIAWLPPESTVPDTFGSDEPFVLSARKLCGAMSNGMIASARELDLYDEHDGILVLDKDIKPGTSFIEAYDFGDYLLDIENKSLTHRPDCFGIIGFAREIAAISGKKFISPDWLKKLDSTFGSKNDLKLSAKIDESDLSDRYTAVIMSNVEEAKQSPVDIQLLLSRVGVRPISAVVDATNYLMMLTGQPLHAFDYDKVLAVAGTPDIHVRSGRDGEKLSLLDGREINLASDDIVIAAGDKAIALAGAMGGSETEIDKNTKNIIIESATFNLYKLRSTQMRHGIFSEAITRFTKGQPAPLTVPVLEKAVKLISEWTGANVASDLADDYQNKKQDIDIIIDLSVKNINDILGVDTNIQAVANVLSNAEFEIIKTDENGMMSIKAPWWRSDIHIKEDLIEEYGRLSGFDNIKPSLPAKSFSAVQNDEFDDFKKIIRESLVRAGANEVLTYSFIHGDVLDNVGHKSENSYKVVNSLSPELQYYRQGLIPSLLSVVNPNIRQGFDRFALFEINKTHLKQDGLNDEGVPIESDMISAVYANKGGQQGAPFYQTKYIFEYMIQKLDLDIEFKSMDSEIDSPITAPFEYRRSAMIIDKKSGIFIGIVGEFKKSVSRYFKLPDFVSGFEINARALFEVSRGSKTNYRPASKYPGSERDICFKVANSVYFDQILSAAKDALNKIDIESDISTVDIYQAEGSDTKNITIKIKLVSRQKTMTSEEVNNIVSAVAEKVINFTGAVVV